MSHPSDDTSASLSRRRLFKTLGLLPVAAALPACTPGADQAGKAEAAPAGPYSPTFFSPAQYACLVAMADRLIPHDQVGPGALELDVPQFIDKHMATPYANGGIWYMQGPFLEAPEEYFGYQGKLALKDILRVGLDAVDAHTRANAGGKAFAGLPHDQQEDLLRQMQAGKLELEAINAKTFFGYLLGEVRNGYFADPVHGGNKGMGSWKMIGYPGMRADYADWVEVRDKPYPLGPVDLAGRRG